MIKKYLLTFHPLEPYFFGDENTIRFDNSNRYFVTSLPVPSAMTILGTLRYTILEQNGLLRANGQYTPQEQQENARYIGTNSFRPEQDTPYGMIHSISPLFLVGPDDRIYIKLPLNHQFGSHTGIYTPMAMGEPVQTSYGVMRLPIPNALSVKDIQDNAYMCIQTGEIIDGLFSDHVQVTYSQTLLTDGFTKKSMKRLKPGFRFGVIAQVSSECVLQDSTCYMGREKSAFSLSVREGFDLEEQIQSGYLGRNASGFGYACSDLILQQPPQYSAFAVTHIKNLRYLSTLPATTQISQSQALHCVICAGSVFYQPKDLVLLGSNRFGMNSIITFGGIQE